MSKLPCSSSRGFTLVEIMVVVAIIALLAAVAIPNYLRARKRSQASLVLEDLRLLSDAVDLYAIEYTKVPGSAFAWTDLARYMKTGGNLYHAANANAVKDILGHPYHTDGLIDGSETAQVSRVTFDSLSDVAPAEYWSPFGIEP
ncbi:MAG: prepilin-type N-terminal cleavage/methylation domain-containing protein [Chthoniobacteraceae bacterium]